MSLRQGNYLQYLRPSDNGVTTRGSAHVVLVLSNHKTSSTSRPLKQLMRRQAHWSEVPLWIQLPDPLSAGRLGTKPDV